MPSVNYRRKETVELINEAIQINNFIHCEKMFKKKVAEKKI